MKLERISKRQPQFKCWQVLNRTTWTMEYFRHRQEQQLLDSNAWSRTALVSDWSSPRASCAPLNGPLDLPEPQLPLT